jgi:hypothetical protein
VSQQVGIVATGTGTTDIVATGYIDRRGRDN